MWLGTRSISRPMPRARSAAGEAPERRLAAQLLAQAVVVADVVAVAGVRRGLEERRGVAVADAEPLEVGQQGGGVVEGEVRVRAAAGTSPAARASRRAPRSRLKPSAVAERGQRRPGLGPRPPDLEEPVLRAATGRSAGRARAASSTSRWAAAHARGARLGGHGGERAVAPARCMAGLAGSEVERQAERAAPRAISSPHALGQAARRPPRGPGRPASPARARGGRRWPAPRGSARRPGAGSA